MVSNGCVANLLSRDAVALEMEATHRVPRRLKSASLVLPPSMWAAFVSTINKITTPEGHWSRCWRLKSSRRWRCTLLLNFLLQSDLVAEQL